MFLSNIISFLTFPGVVAHEWAHAFFCRRSGVPVYKIVYFRFGDPVGYVNHGTPTTFRATFFVSVGPLILNSLLVLLLGDMIRHLALAPWVHIVLFWIAFSIGLHAFPSDHDAENISERIRRAHSLRYYLLYPVVWLLHAANKLRFLFSFNILYTLVLIYLGTVIR